MKVLTKADIQTFFKSDRAILMACIGIALIFWLLLKLSQTFKTSRSCLFSYELPEGKTFLEHPPQKATVTIEGTGWNLISNYFNSKQMALTFKLSDSPSQALNRNEMFEKAAAQLTNVRVTDINNDYIFIQLEDEVSRKVPVVFEKILTFAEGFHQQGDITIQPDSILVSGPQSLVENINYWPSLVFEQQNIKEEIREMAPLVQPENQQLRLTPDEIAVLVPVEQFTEKAMFIPLKILNAPDDSLKVFPATIKLTCVVGLSHYNTLNADSFLLTADLKGISIGTRKNTLPVELSKAPDFVWNVSFNPKSVEFFVVEKAVSKPRPN